LFLSGCHSSKGQSNDDQSSIAQNSDTGFVSIFNGKNLNNWKGDSTYWHVANGTVEGKETNANLLKTTTYLIWQGGKPSNFILKGEYKISKMGNSGVQYRSQMVQGEPYGLKGYQMDIDGANRFTGQLYEQDERDIAAFPGQKVTLPPVSGPISRYAKHNVWTASVVTDTLMSRDSVRALIKPGWNTFRIVAKGNHLQHYINGVLVCDITDNDSTNRSSKGLIGLQLHPGHAMTVQYKNLKLKKL
jgi:hypothetical protein